jgi:hypothetical protein
MKTKWSAGMPLNSKQDRTSCMRSKPKLKKPEIRSSKSSKKRKRLAVLLKNSRNTFVTSCLLRSQRPPQELKKEQRLRSVSEFVRSFKLPKTSR